MKQKMNFKSLPGLIFLLFIMVSCGKRDLQNSEKKDQKPNIIFILADDLGYGDVGFNGQAKIKTPHLDQMAAEGMVFNQFYSGSTVCGPSRAVLMTGLHTGHATVRGNPTWTQSGNPVDLKKEDITVAEELKRAGYVTGVVGKWGLDETSTTGHPNDQGFDYFFGHRTHVAAHHYYPENLWRNKEKIILKGNNIENKTGKYSHDLFTEEALNFIENHKDTTFFLYLAYTIPHLELTVPEDSKLPYQDLGWPERPMQAAHYRNDPEGNTTYAGMISRMDRDIGKLLSLLNDIGIEENTLVIFTSDNGHQYDDGFFGSNGSFRGKKRDLYEGGIRAPFVVLWPGKIKAGTESDHVAAFWDFLPTVCEVAGLNPSNEIDGISFLPALLGQEDKQSRHAHLYWEFNENNGPLQAVLMNQWKGISKYQAPFELYNLEKDPGEQKNIAHENPEIVELIKKKMLESRTDHPEFPLTKREIR